MKTAMAMIAVNRPEPINAPIIIAERIGGTAKITSLARMTKASVSPLRAAASTPSAVPVAPPSATAIAAVDSEFHAPTISMEAMSRPNWSVPSSP